MSLSPTQSSKNIGVSEEKGPADTLRAIVDSLREAVLVVDASMRIANSNCPAKRAFGRRGESLNGLRLSEVIRDPQLHQAFSKAIISGESADVRLDISATDEVFDVHVAPIEAGVSAMPHGPARNPTSPPAPPRISAIAWVTCPIWLV